MVVNFIKVRTRACACALAVIYLLAWQVKAAHAAREQTWRVEGIVTDQAGAPVADALVTLSTDSTSSPLNLQMTTGVDGQFAFDETPVNSGAIKVSARGFALATQVWRAEGESVLRLHIVLAPAPVSEQVTVTATRSEARLGETASSVAVVSADTLAATGALALDDAMRQVVGFQLFRRSGSRTANPTTQGVSLRATGASGASRAVVLADGIPLNDPFGGWVYWGRVPRLSVERIEVLRGGASALYGSGAVGGVIQILSPRAASPVLILEASYGSQHTPDASLYLAGAKGRWGASLAAEVFRTDGYDAVDERERGLIDVPVNSRQASAVLTVERSFAETGHAFARMSYYAEARTNGTPLQTNRTHIRQFSAGGDWSCARLGSLTVRAYGGTQLYDQIFSAVAQGRNSEMLTRVQRVPAQVSGFTAQWSRAFGTRQSVIAGVDGREVRGVSDELIFAQGSASSLVSAGGRERSAGFFFESITRVTPRMFFTGSVRFDRWREFRAESATRPIRQTGTAVVNSFADRNETAFSPQLSVLYKFSERWSLAASFYRAFRGPTLNELYRSFRVGDALTLANENLRAERLTGGEVGSSLNSLNHRLTLRGTLFWSEMSRPVANVTLSVTPGLITRQRQNLGRTRSRGLELEAQARLPRHWTLTGGYLFADATVVRFPANPLLEGARLPQVSRQQLTMQARYDNPARFNFSLQGRATGEQFDDDQNLFRLGSFFALDALVSKRIVRGVEGFFAAENLLNRRYAIGRTPVTTLGQPLLLRFGLRVRLGSK